MLGFYEDGTGDELKGRSVTKDGAVRRFSGVWKRRAYFKE
jgi:hypothetical protein